MNQIFVIDLRNLTGVVGFRTCGVGSESECKQRVAQRCLTSHAILAGTETETRTCLLLFLADFPILSIFLISFSLQLRMPCASPYCTLGLFGSFESQRRVASQA